MVYLGVEQRCGGAHGTCVPHNQCRVLWSFACSGLGGNRCHYSRSGCAAGITLPHTNCTRLAGGLFTGDPLQKCAACGGRGRELCTNCNATGIANRWLYKPSKNGGWGPRGD